MLGACAGVGAQEKLLCPFDAWPFRCLFGLGEEDLLHRFIHPWDVSDEAVADGRKLQVCDECVAVVVAGEGFGVEHVCPEFPALLQRSISWLGGDGVHVVFDGGRFGCFLAGGWEGDAVGGIEVAAAVDEFGVDCAGLGGVDGQGEAGAGFAVVGGKCFVADEESVPDGDALFGEDTGERGDGAGLRPGLSGVVGFAGVDGEEDGCGGGVAGEVVGDGACVGEFLAGLAGEVDAQGRADAVLVQGDADQAFVGPESQGVADEAEDI